MLFGVISDVHSNLEALQAALRILTERGAEEFICCGDIVGYGPSPNEVIETLAALRGLCAVSGNHDLAAVGKMDVEWFNGHARSAVLWTQRTLTASSREFLLSLPARRETKTFTVVHGSPRNPAEEYLLTRQQFLDNLPHFKVSPCFIGHSHLTCCFNGRPGEPGAVRNRLLTEGHAVAVEATDAWMLNPGSVGQPRDRDPRASCGLYDNQKREFQILRAPYDVPAVQRRMRAAGLPEFLALRLAVGQ